MCMCEYQTGPFPCSCSKNPLCTFLPLLSQFLEEGDRSFMAALQEQHASLPFLLRPFLKCTTTYNCLHPSRFFIHSYLQSPSFNIHLLSIGPPPDSSSLNSPSTLHLSLIWCLFVAYTTVRKSLQSGALIFNKTATRHPVTLTIHKGVTCRSVRHLESGETAQKKKERAGM